MTARILPRLGWPLASAAVVAALASVVITFLPGDPGRQLQATDLVLLGAVVLLAGMGALIVSRHSRNPIGWIFLTCGLLYAVLLGAGAYGSASVFGSWPLPGGLVALWLTSWTWAPAFSLLPTLPLLLFPAGRLPSRRWRPLAWLAGLTSATLSFGAAFAPGPLNDYPQVTNPFGLPGAEVLQASMVLIPPIAIASAASLLVRWRRVEGDERQQLKWLALGATTAAISVASGLLIDALTQPTGSALAWALYVAACHPRLGPPGSPS